MRGVCEITLQQGAGRMEHKSKSARVRQLTVAQTAKHGFVGTGDEPASGQAALTPALHAAPPNRESSGEPRLAPQPILTFLMAPPDGTLRPSRAAVFAVPDSLDTVLSSPNRMDVCGTDTDPNVLRHDPLNEGYNTPTAMSRVHHRVLPKDEDSSRDMGNATSSFGLKVVCRAVGRRATSPGCSGVIQGQCRGVRGRKWRRPREDLHRLSKSFPPSLSFPSLRVELKALEIGVSTILDGRCASGDNLGGRLPKRGATKL